MRFGVNILNFSDGATPESLLSRATTAESLGFHSALISDHVAITPGVRPRYPEPFYDVFTTLAWLAGQTSRIQLGTTVCVVPYRHPVLIARMVANIDQLSGGRFIFGVGAGGAQDEFAVLGVPFNRRGAITNEYLEIIHELWAHEEVTYEGKFVTLDQVSGIKPFATGERVHPPVWVGGRSDAAMRRAVRFNADWHPNGMTAGWLRDQGVPRLHEIAIEMGGRLPALVPRIKVALRDQAIDGEARLLGQGSLDQVRGDLELLDELGAEHVLFDWYIAGDMETARDDARAWRMLSLLAEQAIDLQNERLR
jgi:probable F420-dependent oxidoreductase